MSSPTAGETRCLSLEHTQVLNGNDLQMAYEQH